MTIENRIFVLDKNGRSVAFICANDVIMRAGLERDTSLRLAVGQLTGLPIRDCIMDRKPGVSRVVRCWKCNHHFTPGSKIESFRPYYDAGWQPFHINCLDNFKRERKEAA